MKRGGDEFFLPRNMYGSVRAGLTVAFLCVSIIPVLQLPGMVLRRTPSASEVTQ
jgi:hypothetical protein